MKTMLKVVPLALAALAAQADTANGRWPLRPKGSPSS